MFGAVGRQLASRNDSSDYDSLQRTGSFLPIVLEWFDSQTASFVFGGMCESCPRVIFTKPHFSLAGSSDRDRRGWRGGGGFVR